MLIVDFNASQVNNLDSLILPFLGSSAASGSAGSIPLTSELDAAAAAEADVVVSAAAAVAASTLAAAAAAADAVDFVALRSYSTTLTFADYSYSGRPTW